MPDRTLNYAAGKLTNMKKGDIRIVLQFLKDTASAVLPKSSSESDSLT